MTNFEFVFSLFGLLLGLSLAELLGGFGRAPQRRAKLLQYPVVAAIKMIG